MSVESALRILVARGLAIQNCAAGRMLACSIDQTSLIPLLPPDVDIAAVNASSAVVASGPENAIEALSETLVAKGIKHAKLATSHAFHSRHVQPAVDAVRQAVLEETLNKPQVRWYSTISGCLIDDEDAVDANFWAEQVIKPVCFADAVKCAVSDGITVFIELGGRPVLKGAIELVAFELSRRDVEVVSVSSPDAGAFHHLETLWRLGVPIDWDAVHRGDFARRVSLPTTPLEGVWVALTKPGESPRSTPLPSLGRSSSAQTNEPMSNERDRDEITERSIGSYHANSFEGERSPRPPDLITPYVEPLTEDEIRISEIFGRTVSMDGVGADDNLFDIGGTSIMLVHIANFVRDGFGINLPIRDIIDNPTPRGLAQAIARQREQAGEEP